MIDGNFEPGAPITNFLKDLNTIVETARELNIRLPIVEAIRNVYQELFDKGFEGQDHSAFLLHLEALNASVALTRSV